MTLLQALILGIVQGLTEFLPVSSSAHLVLVPHLLGWNLAKEFVFPFDVLVQLGTLAAVIVYFRKDLAEIVKSVIRGLQRRQPFKEVPARIGWLAILATIPAGILGLLFKDKVETAFHSATATSLFLFVTAGLLLAAEFIGKRKKDFEKLTVLDALWIGIFQAISIFPGVSRSGSTIAGGMMRNLDRKSSGQFSFIMAIPIFLAAGFLGIKALFGLPKLASYLPALLIGFFAAGIVGFFAIRWLLGYITNHSLLPFAGYCLVLGAGTLAFTLLNPSLPDAVVPTSSQPPVQAENAPENVSSIYKVSFVSDLEWLLPSMVECQNAQQGLNILLSQEALAPGKPAKAAIALAYGEIEGISTEVFQLGSDLLVPIVHKDSPLTLLSLELAEAVLSGQIRTWEAATEFCPECFFISEMKGDINLYAYTPGTPLYETTSLIYGNSKPLSSAARLAPNSAAIREALRVDLQGLSIMPKSWHDSTFITIDYETKGGVLPSIPILAYTHDTLPESLKEWLVCVQNSIK